jgi:trans-aconitate methyltransferase
MRHRDAVAMFDGARLDRPAPSVWADLGSGDGTFTLALADLLSSGSTIHAIDRDASVLRGIASSSGSVHIEKHVADFTRRWPIDGPIDGILMANSLHFVRDKESLLRTLSSRLTPAGRFLIVEYDKTFPNPWVPFPVNAKALPELFGSVGFARFQMLGTRPSSYQRGRLYAALVER